MIIKPAQLFGLAWSLRLTGQVAAPSRRKCRVQIPQGSPRQKKPAPFRFRGLRKSRESSISAVSFFLFQIGPALLGSDLGRALCRIGVTAACLTLTQEVVVLIHDPVPYTAP